MSVIALDIGTSNIKALLARWDGTVFDGRSVKTPVRTDRPGWHCFPVDEIYEQAAQLVTQIAGAHPDDPIDTIVFSCLGTAMVPLDTRGRPLGSALSPADMRPLNGGTLEERVGLDAETLRFVTGSDPSVSSFLLHWLWWRDAQPDVVERLHRFRSLRGFLVQELCGADAEDHSWASRTMLLDLETNDWSTAILDVADLSLDKLPTIHPPTAHWDVRRSAAELFNLAPSARVVLGGMDNCCSFLGAADPDERRLVNIVGTYEHLIGTGDLASVRSSASSGGGIVHSHVLPDQYIGMTREPIGLLIGVVAETTSEPIERLLDQVSDKATGARFELSEEAVRSALQAGATPLFVLQGLLESAAARIAHFADAWDATGQATDHVAAVGGGARGNNLLQLKANILGRRVATLSSNETAGLGALRIAAMAVSGATPAVASELFPNPFGRMWSPRF